MRDAQGNDVPWIEGGNTEPSCGDCLVVAFANFTLKRLGIRMSLGEIQYAYSKWTGWSPLDPSTNHGTNVLSGLTYWRDQGFPADCLDRIAGFDEISVDQIQATVARDGGCVIWVMLPLVDDDWDFADDALGTPGTGAHAMFVTDADDGLIVVTWGEERRVSWAWARAFLKGAYAIDFAASDS